MAKQRTQPQPGSSGEPRSAGRALAESERFMRASLDALTTHIAVLDGDGRILTTNKAWRRFAARNELAWEEPRDAANYLEVCDRAAAAGDADAATSAALIRKVIAGRSRECSFEYPCHGPREQRWFLCRVTRFPGRGPVRVVVAHENITERRQAEEALARSYAELELRVVERTAELQRAHQFSESLIDTVQSIVLLLSPEGRIIRFNRHLEELSGWSLDEARGRSWFNLFLPRRDRARIRALFRRAVGGQRTRGNINPILTKDGREVAIEWHDAMLQDADGRLVGLLCSGRDITERLRAEAALRESEERYRQLVHALPTAVYTCDAEGRVVLYNAAAVKLWGREPAIGRERWGGAHRIFAPDGRRLPPVRYPMAMTLRRGQPVRGVEMIVERPDGSRSHVLAFPDLIRDSAGRITGGVNVLADITALKATESALRTAERKLRTLSQAVEQSPASVVITNLDGEIEYVNPKFTEVTGYSLAEVLGENPRLLKSGHQHPTFYREMWETITAGRDWRGEFCNRKKNGELFWEYAVIAPIHDAKGAVTHFVAIKEDITERRRAVDELRAREAWLRAILNTVADAVITIDRRGTIIGVNPATERMFGHAESEMLGQSVEMLMPSPYREEYERYLAEYHRTGQARMIGAGRELQARRKDGSVFPIELAVGEVGHMQMFTGVIRDITERKRLEGEVLRVTEEERQRVATDLHDGICQELIGIGFVASAVQRDLEPVSRPLAAKVRKIASAISTAAGHTRAVARGMNPVVADGDALMHTLRQLAAETARTHRVRCVFECRVPVRVEDTVIANQLYRIAQEAIHNAIRHSGAKRVTVRLSENDAELCLAVLDNGRGIPAHASHGAGMGLRAMKYRAGLMRGHFTIQARKRGGTEVTCRIPKQPAKR